MVTVKLVGPLQARTPPSHPPGTKFTTRLGIPGDTPGGVTKPTIATLLDHLEFGEKERAMLGIIMVDGSIVADRDAPLHGGELVVLAPPVVGG